MPRSCEIGIRIGSFPTGPTNSVPDVAASPHRRGMARTGVTTLVSRLMGGAGHAGY